MALPFLLLLLPLPASPNPPHLLLGSRSRRLQKSRECLGSNAIHGLAPGRSADRCRPPRPSALFPLPQLPQPVLRGPSFRAQAAREAQHGMRSAGSRLLQHENSQLAVANPLPGQAVALLQRELAPQVSRNGHLAAFGDDGDVGIDGGSHAASMSCVLIM